MEGRETFPFRGGPENAEWRLNYSNPFVAAFTGADSKNLAKLGKVGELGGGAAEYVLIWRIVSEAHVPLSDIEKEWTFDRICCFGAYLGMKQDYKSAWTELYSQENEKRNA